MEITGPVAPAEDPSPAVPRAGCLGGCASGCATALGMAGLLVVSGAGALFELTQPHHRARASVPDGACELSWWRSATGGARYRITCDARRDLELTRFKLLSGPRGVPLVESVEGFGQRPWEDQRPLAGETVHVDGGRSWTYDGTLSLGPVPYMGPPAEVTLTVVADERKLTLRAAE